MRAGFKQSENKPNWFKEELNSTGKISRWLKGFWKSHPWKPLQKSYSLVTDPNPNSWLGLARRKGQRFLSHGGALVNMVMICLPLKLGPTPLYYLDHSLVGPSYIDFWCDHFFEFHPMNCLESWLCINIVSEVVKLTKASCFIQCSTKIFWWATSLKGNISVYINQRVVGGPH